MNPTEYDKKWKELSDFIKYNPGARHRRNNIIKLLKSVNFNSLADVGCGTGELLLYLSKFYDLSEKKFTGTDFAVETVENNKKQMPDVEFFVQNIEKDVLDRQFDVVVCSEVIEHLEHQQQAIANLSKMVKKGGYLILTVPTGKMYPTEVNFGHIKHPSVKDIAFFAEENGLRTEKLYNWGFPVYKTLKEITNINPEWSIKNFGSGSYSFPKKLINNAIYLANCFNFKNSPFGCQIFALLRKK